MGIDVSARATGVVLMEEPEEACRIPRVRKALEVTGVADGRSDAALFERARIMAAKVVAVAEFRRPRLVAVEGYGFASKRLADSVTVGTLVRERLWKAGLPWVVVAPTQLKKFILGVGRGDKGQHRVGVYKRWLFEHDSDNVVDAYGLGCVAMAALGKLPGLIAPQQQVLDRLDRSAMERRLR